MVDGRHPVPVKGVKPFPPFFPPFSLIGQFHLKSGALFGVAD